MLRSGFSRIPLTHFLSLTRQERFLMPTGYSPLNFQVIPRDIRGSNMYEPPCNHSATGGVLQTGNHPIFEDAQDGESWRHSVHPSVLPEG